MNTEPDIVQQLRSMGKTTSPKIGDLCFAAANEIERLQEELEIWKDRYHAEHQDHEALVKALEDEERNRA